MRQAAKLLGAAAAITALLALSSCDGLDGWDSNYLAVGDGGFMYAPLAITDVRLDGREPDYLEQANPHEYMFERVDPGIYELTFTYAQVPMVTTIQVNSGWSRITVGYFGFVWDRWLHRVTVIDPPRPLDGQTFALDGESLRLMTNIGLHPTHTYRKIKIDGKAPDRARMGPPHELLWDNLEPGRYTMTWEQQGENHSVEFELRKEGAMLACFGGRLYSLSRDFSFTQSDREYDDSSTSYRNE